jgi:nitrogen fixation/metabolism regulation signal transduction histidine kinase
MESRFSKARRVAERRSGFRLEARLRWLLVFFGLILIVLGAWILRLEEVSLPSAITVLVLVAIAWSAMQMAILDRVVRPLQTLANVVGALREQDYSFRARGAWRGDAFGDLACEINALAGEMQSQRLAVLDSAALAAEVMGSIDAPVLVFDRDAILRFLNPAASRWLRVASGDAVGRSARQLALNHLFEMRNEQVISRSPEDQSLASWPAQWMLRRTAFRQGGVPYTLILLSNVSAALREEERQAWQRLIRVMGHEINNSLTPIKSLAGTLRSLVRLDFDIEEIDGALAIIEDRAESLNRFLNAYREFSQLPAPVQGPVSIRKLVERVAALETRAAVEVVAGPETMVSADADQLTQALINLVRNAAEAAGSAHPERPLVAIAWELEPEAVCVQVVDNGAGVTNPSNLLVPFYTTKPNGTGIGLALARQIAEAHGGSLKLINRPEGGARAELRIPAGREKPAGSGPPAAGRGVTPALPADAPTAP